MKRLEGKVAVITGAGSGIGRAAALMFAAEGARVAVLDRARQLGEAAVAEVTAAGGEARAIHSDVTDEASVQAAMAATVTAFGQIDVLFNCAGGSSQRDRPVHEVDLALWKSTMDLDLSGTFLCCRHAIPHMLEKQRGSVINVGTWGALRGALPKHIYVSAKGAILSLTRAIAGEYTPCRNPRQCDLPGRGANRTLDCRPRESCRSDQRNRAATRGAGGTIPVLGGAAGRYRQYCTVFGFRRVAHDYRCGDSSGWRTLCCLRHR